MGTSYDYQCLISELHSFEQALKTVDRAITLAPPTGRDALDIAAETTTCLELLKKFDDRIKSYQKALGGRKGASWRKIVGASSKLRELQLLDRKSPIISRKSHCSCTGWRCKYWVSSSGTSMFIIPILPSQPVLDLLPMWTKQDRAQHRQGKYYWL